MWCLLAISLLSSIVALYEMKSVKMETLKTLEEITAYDSEYRRDTKFVPSTDWTAYFDTSKGTGDTPGKGNETSDL